MYQGKRTVIGMPAYNEEANIEQAVRSFLNQQHVDDVVVVDNNSSDDTAEIASGAGATVVSESQQGYGYACQRALAEANERGDIIGLVEPDGTFVARDIEKLLSYIPDFDFVVGTRTSSELIWEGANMGPFLQWGNWIVAKLLEIMHNTSSITDVGCTFRIIRSEAYEKIRDQFTVGGSHFSPEMLIRVAQQDISMVEVPVNYRARKGESKITGDFVPAVKLGLVMIAFIIQQKIN
jgi:glycosyltransferase involved in cell wall biosynthesis